MEVHYRRWLPRYKEWLPHCEGRLPCLLIRKSTPSCYGSVTRKRNLNEEFYNSIIQRDDGQIWSQNIDLSEKTRTVLFIWVWGWVGVIEFSEYGKEGFWIGKKFLKGVVHTIFRLFDLRTLWKQMGQNRLYNTFHFSSKAHKEEKNWRV